jgi:hypothetical protein
MSGYIKCYRDVFDHDLFPAEEFSRREAWIWLTANAAWKSRRFRHRNKMISISRGQLPGARKHLAEVWGWGEQRVRTFLDELCVEGMVSLSTNQQITIITICNYEKFQGQEDGSNQQLTSIQPAANHTKERKEIKEDTILTREAPKIDLHHLANQLHEAGGAALNRTTGAMESVEEPLTWMKQGADLELHILPTVRQLSSKRNPGTINSWRYFETAVIERMHQRNSTIEAFRKPRPVPQVASQDGAMSYFQAHPTPVNVLPAE